MHVFCVHFACKSTILHAIYVGVHAAIPVACTVRRGRTFGPVNNDSLDKNITISLLAYVAMYNQIKLFQHYSVLLLN